MLSDLYKVPWRPIMGYSLHLNIKEMFFQNLSSWSWGRRRGKAWHWCTTQEQVSSQEVAWYPSITHSLSSKATRENLHSSSIWQQRNLRISNHPRHRSKGAELAVLRVIVSHSHKGHLFECIIIYKTWRAPAKIRGPGCCSVNPSVSCILLFFPDF